MYILGIFVGSALLLIDRLFQIEFKNNTCVSIPSNFGKVGQQAFVRHGNISYSDNGYLGFIYPYLVSN